MSILLLKVNLMLHKHRILPGHMGGTYTPENVALLTVPQHAEAHRLLWENFGKQEDFIAWRALSQMMGREEIIAAVLHLPKSAEHKRKIGLAIRGNKRPDLVTRNLLGLTKGQPKSQAHRQRISQAMMGHVVSEATRAKISVAHKGRS